ncbi:valyl-tRNA synthetase [Filimonas lacunae]|uniref:Valine--tRNA ligase n=1 Tax=Filimonas lacunae TaxID=477680 RepID=A0A173MDU7_9BACT|nr:valine--tRNA ligase [Filimonas lacunae]BAV05773.1 valyl-tRNA synthetase [Filimonas lacunae]SIT28665.1 valyl-tRNA synthetase [Filimonas lacunae]
MELSKNFEPAQAEQKWYKHWQNKGYFNSKPDGRKAFTVVIPPPNVTGVLHMGHTLNETVQDILVRNARMSGYNACWVPGSDHASIATEAKVVQMLEKEKGIKKADLSREEFLKYAFEWKEKYGGIIYNQIERLGCSVDWDRVNFTMDDHYYKAVIKTFIDLYNKGLIYRGARMINWDPRAKTALSDEEVIYKDAVGKLYHVKYKVKDSDEYITVATQRPETIMGDTALCVNPTDERYAHLKGKKVIVPMVNREIPVIFDEYVDPAFGTGALKVTPAHDINDYNLGLKHNLEVIDTLNPDGTLSTAAQVYVGKDRFEARKLVVQQLTEEGLLVKVEENPTRVAYSERNPDTVVEPRISTQWWVKMKEITEPALKAVVDGDIKIHPGDKFLATYKHWLENVKDWCISRQLWWGQQIPAWYTKDGNFVVAATSEEAVEAFKKQNITVTAEDLKQDEDVLDTWFSSWLWPVEVFNGITQPGNEEINYYYPTSVLVTGQDIIFFWVARMVMAGMEYQKEIPFKDVYFTGMVRDKQGRKMSKSLGNSPDLLNLIDKYGADAVRFGIMISAPAGTDLLFDEDALNQGGSFNIKIWNALRLIKGWETRIDNTISSTSNTFALEWFDQRLQQVRSEIEKLIGQFRLSEALKTVYSLIWDDFCSWYLEWIKPGFKQPISAEVYQKTVNYFEQLLQILHPFMPFITEEIYHLLKEQTDDLCVKQYPENNFQPAAILKTGELLKQVITAIRDARNKNQLKPKDTIQLQIQASDPASYQIIESILAKQVNAEQVSFTTETVSNAVVVAVEKDKFFFTSNQEVDKTALKAELEKDLEYQQGFLESVMKKLSNERFIQNAKPEVVAIEKKKQADAEARIKTIQESLNNL